MFAVVLLNCSCSVDCYVVFHVLYTLSLSCCFLFWGGTWSSLFVFVCFLLFYVGVGWWCFLLWLFVVRCLFYVFLMFLWLLATRFVVWLLFMCSLPALLVYRGFLHVVSYMPVVTKYCLYLVC